jgi:hypothetical protein
MLITSHALHGSTLNGKNALYIQFKKIYPKNCLGKHEDEEIAYSQMDMLEREENDNRNFKPLSTYK